MPERAAPGKLIDEGTDRQAAMNIEGLVSARSRPWNWCRGTLGATLTALLCLAGVALAQSRPPDYPSRAIRVIVPFTTGGAADITARVVGERLSERLRQPVVVENRAGGGGVLALDLLRNAPADGYTLGIAANSNATKPATMPNLPWDLARDFAYIAIAVDATMVLVGNPERMPARNLTELTAWLRSHPGEVSYGSCGIASTQQFAMEKYRFMTQAAATHVPYKGCAVATPEVLSGQIELAMVALSNVLPYTRSGRLRAYGVTTARRSTSAPEIPTFAESGVPALADYAQDAWYGFFAPAGTPSAIIEFLAAEIRTIVSTESVRARLHDVGLQAMFIGPQAMRQRMLADVESFTRISAMARIKAE
jgi:tripartite-type tricarboxylate transporter receptor subunit TctC